MRPVRERERGAVAVLVAAAVAALLGLVALVLNVGHRLDTRAELQNAADSAALAGAAELNGEIEPIMDGLPVTRAIDFSGRHTSGAAVPVTIGAGDVQLGRWDLFASDPATAFTPITVQSDADAWLVNAVRVVNGREQARGNALEVFMGNLLGRATQDVGAEAIAVNGGPCNLACPTVPFTFFDCGIFKDYDLHCGKHVRTTTTYSDPNDTVGWTSLSTDPATPPTAKDILNADPTQCGQYAVQTGQPIHVSNGSYFGAICNELRARIGIKSIAPIVGGECPPKFNQVHQVVGFATFEIVGVECAGNPKFIEFEFHCNEHVEPDGRIGCGFYGTGPLQPQLVR
jgi:hypothetical protein